MMNWFRTLTVLSGVSLALVGEGYSQMPSAAETVRIEVKTVSSSDRKEIKDSREDTITQNKVLEISVTGKPKTPETRVVKWSVFGRDQKDKDVTELESGEYPLDLSNGGRQMRESKKVSTTFTGAHTAGKGKKVPASGSKYVGYAIQVREGTKILGEAYDPAGLKAKMK